MNKLAKKEDIGIEPEPPDPNLLHSLLIALYHKNEECFIGNVTSDFACSSYFWFHPFVIKRYINIDTSYWKGVALEVYIDTEEKDNRSLRTIVRPNNLVYRTERDNPLFWFERPTRGVWAGIEGPHREKLANLQFELQEEINKEELKQLEKIHSEIG